MKQSELKKIDQVVNISTFEDSICFFDNYDQLVSSYNMLVEEMMTYSISNDNDPKYEYMFDFNKIKNKMKSAKSLAGLFIQFHIFFIIIPLFSFLLLNFYSNYKKQSCN